MKAIRSLLLAATAFSIVPHTQAAMVLFDFGRHDGGVNGDTVANPATPNGGSGLFHWNSVGESAQAQTVGTAYTGLVDTGNNALAGWTLTTGSNVQANGFLNGGLIATGTSAGAPIPGAHDPVFSALGVFAVPNATGDFWFVDGGGGSATGSFTLSGLNAGLTYDFTFFAHRWGTATRFSNYTAVGLNSGSASLQSTGTDIGADTLYDGNDDETVSIIGIQPTPGGEITIAFTNNTGQQFAYVNAMRVDFVPEPTTAAMLLGGVGTLLLARRRR